MKIKTLYAELVNLETKLSVMIIHNNDINIM